LVLFKVSTFGFFSKKVLKIVFFRRKSGLGAPVGQSLVRLVRYHLGSCAFGSLLVAVVQVLRVILQAVHNTVKQGEANMCKTNLGKICGCCLAVFEKFLAFINRNAYIEIGKKLIFSEGSNFNNCFLSALRSTNFLESSHRAISVIGSNALRVAAINSVGDFVLFLGKVKKN